MPPAPAYALPTIDANRVMPKLWIGSAPSVGPGLAHAGFDAVVLAAEEYQPTSRELPGVRVIHAPFGDTRWPTDAEIRRAVRAADMVAAHLAAGDRVLVSCWMGRNRSGLVTALALRRLGVPPNHAVELVRRARPGALFNDAFVTIVREL